MGEGAWEVATGSGRAQEAGQALAAILRRSDALRYQVEQIASAAGQMSLASNELVGAMDAVSAVEQNSAAVEEVSAAAEEMTAQVEEVTALAQTLAEMAQTFQALVSQFTLTGTGTLAGPRLQNGAQPTTLNPSGWQAPPVPRAVVTGDGHSRA